MRIGLWVLLWRWKAVAGMARHLSAREERRGSAGWKKAVLGRLGARMRSPPQKSASATAEAARYLDSSPSVAPRPPWAEAAAVPSAEEPQTQAEVGQAVEPSC